MCLCGGILETQPWYCFLVFWFVLWMALVSSAKQEDNVWNVAWCHSGTDLWLAGHRLLCFQAGNVGNVVCIRAPVTKQYSLVPAIGQWCCTAWKVGLVSHLLCITNSWGISMYWLMAYEYEMNITPLCVRLRNMCLFWCLESYLVTDKEDVKTTVICMYLCMLCWCH